MSNLLIINVGIPTNTICKQAKTTHPKINKKHTLATSQQCEIQDPRNTNKCNVKLHKYLISTAITHDIATKLL